MSKTKGFLLTAGLGLALAFTFSCGNHGIDELINGSGTAPSIITTQLPGGTVNTAYSQALAATGDTPITWSLESGELPTGLSLLGNGIISGTPATANTFSFIVKATNATGNDMKVLSITITAGSEPPPGGSSSSIPNPISSSSVIPNPISSSSVGGGGDDFASKPWTYVSTSTFGTTQINSIAYGNNRFVAVGNDGKMATSTDGVNWTSVNMGNTAYIQPNGTGRVIDDVAFGNGRWFAVGSGVLATSTDGVTWTTAAASGMPTNNVVFGGNRWVIANSGTSMRISTDGVTWTRPERTADVGGVGNNRLAFGGNRWVAVGTGGRIMTSTDGINWAALTPLNGWNMGAVAWGNNRWVAMGGSTGEMITSTDGTNWTVVERANAGGLAIQDIVYANNRWVAVGSSGRIATSTNGTNWTAIDVLSVWGSSNNQIRAVAFGNGMFVAGGQGGKMAYSYWP